VAALLFMVAYQALMANYLFSQDETGFCRSPLFDTGDNLDGTSTMSTGLHVNIEYPFQSLSPGHGRPSFSIGFVIF
jgi:hypothetical protein